MSIHKNNLSFPSMHKEIIILPWPILDLIHVNLIFNQIQDNVGLINISNPKYLDLIESIALGLSH